MPPQFNARIQKMIYDMRLPVGVNLHTDSEEAEVERSVAGGQHGFRVKDPKVRRVAYAPGFMEGGGSARQEFLRKRTAERIPGA